MPRPDPSLRSYMTAVILSGGMGRRMAGHDKGLLPLAGRPMIAHVLDQVIPQADEVMINANRNIAEYQQLGARVIRDRMGGFQGPLAGMACSLEVCATPLLLVTPCDSPLIPLDLGYRLYEALEQAHTEVAVVHDGKRLHPVFALLRKQLLPSLNAYMESGGRKIEEWIKSLHHSMADCSDIAENFINVNNPDELARIEAQLRLKENGPRRGKS